MLPNFSNFQDLFLPAEAMELPMQTEFHSSGSEPTGLLLCGTSKASRTHWMWLLFSLRTIQTLLQHDCAVLILLNEAYRSARGRKLKKHLKPCFSFNDVRRSFWPDNTEAPATDLPAASTTCALNRSAI